MLGNKAKLKTSKSKIFIMLIVGFFIIYGVIRSSGMYCAIWRNSFLINRAKKMMPASLS